MTDFWNAIGTWSVLKWVILVLIAAFIGQIGKTMAQAIIGKVRRWRTKESAGEKIDPPQFAPTPQTPPSFTPQDQVSPVANQPDKKTLKTLAKMQKKAAKNSKK